MVRTREAVIEQDDSVKLLEPADFKVPRRALVTILDEEPRPAVDECARPGSQSGAALAEDWNRPEEDAAWSHLQPAR